jgi:hypothetical protein
MELHALTFNTILGYPSDNEELDAQLKTLEISGLQTGLISPQDSTRLTVLDPSTLRILPIQGAVFSPDIIVGDPNQFIFSFPNPIDFDLNTFSPLPNGNYIRFIGIDKNGAVAVSPTFLYSTSSVVQLGLIYFNVNSGVVTFLNSSLNVLNLPQVSSTTALDREYNRLECTSIIAPNANLTIRTLQGNLIGPGINVGTVNPNKRIIQAIDPSVFRRFSPADYLSTAVPVTTNTVVTSDYWNGSAVVPVPLNTDATIQRWIRTTAGELLLQMGEAVYVDITDAQAAVYTAPFTDALVPGTYVEIARMVAVKNATDLTLVSQAVFYGNIISTGAAGSGFSEQQVRDTPLTGLLLNQSAPINALDTVLTAFSKIGGVGPWQGISIASASANVSSTLQYRFENAGQTVRLRGAVWPTNNTLGALPANGIVGLITQAPYFPVAPGHFSNDVPNFSARAGCSALNAPTGPCDITVQSNDTSSPIPGQIQYFNLPGGVATISIDVSWSII